VYDGTDGFNFVTNPVVQLPLKVTVERIAFAKGKFEEVVWPTTVMFPLASTAMPFPLSSLLPPIRVENNKPEPDEFSFVTNASDKPFPVPAAYRTEALAGSLTRLRTPVVHKPVSVLVQLLPPFVVLIIPRLFIAAYTAEEVATIALTPAFGTPFVRGAHEVPPLVL
jgi:hypothetical protein